MVNKHQYQQNEHLLLTLESLNTKMTSPYTDRIPWSGMGQAQ